jgi:hypothetical protein
MWETNYAHPTAQWLTPTSKIAVAPEQAIEYSFEGVKVCTIMPAKLYRIP